MRARNLVPVLTLLALGLASAATAERVALRAPGGLYVSAARSGGALRADARQVGPQQTFEIVRLAGNRISLTTEEGLYVSASSADGALLADRRDAGVWETFELVQLGGGRVALRANDRRYVTTENGGQLYANRDAARSRETFEIVRLQQRPDDQNWNSSAERYIALRTDDGSLLSAGEYGDQLRADQRQIGDSEVFLLKELGQGRIALRAWNGRYISADDGRLELGGRRINTREVFDLVPQQGDQLALRAYNGRYLTAEDGGGREVTINRSTVRAWEIFRLERADPYTTGGGEPALPPTAGTGLGRRVALQTERGYYITTRPDGELRANANSAAERETFELVEIDADHLALRAANGRFVSADGGGGGELRANRERPRDWETFHIRPQGGGRIAFETERGYYLTAQIGGNATMRADRSSVGNDEIFRLVELDDSTYGDPRDDPHGHPHDFPNTPRHDDPPDNGWTEPLRSGPSYRLTFQTQRGTYLTLDSQDQLSARGSSPGQREVFELIPLAGDRAALRASNGRFVSVDGKRVLATANQLDRYSIFTLERLAEGGQALRAWNGRYLSAEDGGGGSLTADREHARAWEIFRVNVISQGSASAPNPAPAPSPGGNLGGRIALKTQNGFYLTVSSDGRLRADARTAGQQESFDLVKLDGDRVALRASNGRYVTALQSADRGLVADRSEVGTWESFRLVRRGGDRIALMTRQARFLSADAGGGNGLRADTYEAGDWETFQLVELR